MKEDKKIKISLTTFILMITIIILLIIFSAYILFVGFKNKEAQSQLADSSTNTAMQSNDKNDNKEETVKNNANVDLDYGFLKLENKKENMVYSPLSIKYALKMLEEASNGETKAQISNLTKNYNLTKYASNANMSLANALFIRDSFKGEVKNSYINTLKNNYDAEVKFDSFKNAENINNWISEKTYEIIPSITTDEEVSQLDFALINALAIDMEWEKKFLTPGGVRCEYSHENFWWNAAEQVMSHEFDKNKQLISGMEIVASINNYDIITELGEANIRKTVGDEFKKWANDLREDSWEYNEIFGGDLSDEKIEEKLNQYLDGGKFYSYHDSEGYFSELNSNYKRVDSTTDFSVFVDERIKVFAKDLKEYSDTTLQYVAIMPKTEDLNTYIENINEKEINNIISNLKELKPENFKEGVVTKITGYIPKFKFEYDLDLMEDLKSCNVTNVFDKNKADLSNLTDSKAYISTALHKANIEFTQDGIKAAAATGFGGAGAGDIFDYKFDVPVEEIDMTFDKPYMFVIRDKETGEIWFAGTVYEPLLWENEPEKDKRGGT